MLLLISKLFRLIYKEKKIDGIGRCCVVGCGGLNFRNLEKRNETSFKGGWVFMNQVTVLACGKLQNIVYTKSQHTYTKLKKIYINNKEILTLYNANLEMINAL